ncbi:hypothetical protein [Vibrio phage vB_VmeM-Yong XC32]|nr:hypothetical protein [Vibrio phage vB_VmeM-Yong XC31]QAX96378.1 hypothetical protein [Vibrio phage vB_VmeM-Yong XC32]QAX96696.1 hypothetical protein [Vibrio phage vB_VmeM-Yong MS31]QAX97014.1 hypothetical protein [Vibrio phage vB_VmeM-Yong MS32]
MAKTIVYLSLDSETMGFNYPVKLEDGTYVAGCNHYPLVQVAGTILSEDLEEQVSFDYMVQPTAEEMARSDEGTVQFHIENGFDVEWETRERLPLHEVEDRIIFILTSYFTANHREFLVDGKLPAYDAKAKYVIIVHGKSVNFDKSFINAQMPRLGLILGHQVADTSSTRTMMYPSKILPNRLSRTQSTHFALDDVGAAVADQRALVEFMEIIPKHLGGKKFDTLEEITEYVSKNGLSYIPPKSEVGDVSQNTKYEQ